MSETPRCPCLLCRLEAKLLRELDAPTSRENYHVLYSASPPLAGFPEAEFLLAHLRSGRADGSSDQILLELTKWQNIFRDGLVTNLFLLAFLPMLHAAVRETIRHYPHLTWEDAAQQAILVFLEFLQSDQFRSRESHLAFALSRAVKRRIYEWAHREAASTERPALSVFSRIFDEDALERQVLLRHLLDRAGARGFIDTSDVQLLIQIKLDGEPGELFCEELGLTPNAFRQRVKRLFAKLRRIARARPGRSSSRGKAGKTIP
jgi:hypothetical protein